MTTQTSTLAAAAREAARTSTGQFGAQHRGEADIEIGSGLSASAASPQPRTLDRAPSSFGEQITMNSWEYLPGPQIRSSFATPLGSHPDAVTGAWTTTAGVAGGKLTVQSPGKGQGLSFSAPHAVAAVSNLTAHLDRQDGRRVPYRRNDKVTDAQIIDVVSSTSPGGYSPRIATRDQWPAARESYQQALADRTEAVLSGHDVTAADLDDAARACYVDSLVFPDADPDRAAALGDESHPDHELVRAQAWGQAAAAALFLTRGQGDPTKMSDTLYHCARAGHDADEAWDQVIVHHGEHRAPAHLNTGACTNVPGEPAPKRPWWRRRSRR